MRIVLLVLSVGMWLGSAGCADDGESHRVRSTDEATWSATGWGANCTFNESFDVVEKSAFQGGLFVNGVTDLQTQALTEGVFIDPSTVSYATVDSALTPDDIMNNIAVKTGQWSGLGSSINSGYRYSFQRDAFGQVITDPAQLTVLHSGLPFPLGRNESGLWSSPLQPPAENFQSAEYHALQDYFEGTLQPAKVPDPLHPGKMLALEVVDLMIADGRYQVPVGAVLSCIVVESVMGHLRDPMTQEPILPVSYSGTIWTNSAPLGLIDNCPSSFPMPTQTSDLMGTKRVTSKPPNATAAAAAGVGSSASDPRVLVAGSARLDLTPMQRMPQPTVWWSAPSTMYASSYPSYDLGTAPPRYDLSTAPPTYSYDAGSPPPPSPPPSPPDMGPPPPAPCPITGVEVAGTTTSTRSYTGLAVNGVCGSCSADADCQSVLGPLYECLDAGVNDPKGNPIHSCAFMPGCTPSATFDFNKMNAYSSATTAAELQTARRALDELTTTPTFSCWLPIELVPVASRHLFSGSGTSINALGVFWCASTSWSDETQYNLRDACGET